MRGSEAGSEDIRTNSCSPSSTLLPTHASSVTLVGLQVVSWSAFGSVLQVGSVLHVGSWAAACDRSAAAVCCGAIDGVQHTAALVEPPGDTPEDEAIAARAESMVRALRE